MEYFKDPNLSFFDWFNDFFNSSNYAVFSNYYRSVYLNFFISFLIVYGIKKALFKIRLMRKKLIIQYWFTSF